MRLSSFLHIHRKLLHHFFVSFILLASLLSGCNRERQHVASVQGTWQLVTGTLIEKGDTTVTDYTKGISMIKILNETHFAFLNHDLNHGKDSTASFSAGGGKYTLNGDEYVEHLTYCSAREWEGHDFKFTLRVNNDTLIQQGVEKLEDIGVERLNIERYVRVKD